MEIKEHLLEPRPREVQGAEKQDDIYLSIAIGNGQIGGSKVTQKDHLLAKGSLTQLTYLGKSNDLKNGEIDIETNILDINSFTNRCVLITTFYNQNKKILFTKIDKGDAPENGVASFKAKYTISLLSLMLFFFFF